MAAIADSNWLGALARGLGVALLIAGAALALMFAFAAALVIAFVVAGAALALRLAPGRRERGEQVLEAHRTPDGWVVETLKP
jgi:hypothetical protein